MLNVDSYPHENPQDSHTGYTDERETYLVSEHRLEGYGSEVSDTQGTISAL